MSLAKAYSILRFLARVCPRTFLLQNSSPTLLFEMLDEFEEFVCILHVLNSKTILQFNAGKRHIADSANDFVCSPDVSVPAAAFVADLENKTSNI